MVKSMEITKVTIRNRLVVDAQVLMDDPKDYDFSPRADIEGSTLSLRNEGDEGAATSIELDSEQMNPPRENRCFELRVKFAVEGMHGGADSQDQEHQDSTQREEKSPQPRWKTPAPAQHVIAHIPSGLNRGRRWKKTLDP
ncbi:MAG: hypothetical protein Ct9H300mP10_07480 [Methanobacteriota archaeon]|nr:MAG: hypothetical protein Ct9H300mP10_07480 [Euryarchaeota archaeon]